MTYVQDHPNSPHDSLEDGPSWHLAQETPLASISKGHASTRTNAQSLPLDQASGTGRSHIDGAPDTQEHPKTLSALFMSGQELAHQSQDNATNIQETAAEQAVNDTDDETLANVQWIYARLLAAFPGAIIQVDDTRGDDQHLSVTLASSAFAEKTRIACHQMVYAALDHMRHGRIHAMALRTHIV